MSNKAKARRKPAAVKRNPDEITVYCKPGDDAAAAMAQSHLRPTVQAGCTVRAYNKGKDESGPDINALIAELGKQAEAVSGGDLRRAEAMLLSQAHSLDAIFGNLARRAASNFGEYLNAAETYMRLALRAQSQCRATLETLALIKNPAPVAFVRQTNIGQAVQVNNAPGAAGNESRAREIESAQSRLLEAQHGERLDSETEGTASGADPQLATVGKIDRPENPER